MGLQGSGASVRQIRNDSESAAFELPWMSRYASLGIKFSVHVLIRDEDPGKTRCTARYPSHRYACMHRQALVTSVHSSNARLERAVHTVGIHSVPDVNSPNAPAAGYATLDICVDEHAYRSSTFHAFLPPELAYARRDRLKICTNSIVTRLKISKVGDILRATGVHFEAIDPRFADVKVFAKATREVILCAGALGSPQILMLRYVALSSWHTLTSLTCGASGIGPRHHLTEKGISTVCDLPAVGSNLVCTTSLRI